MKVNKYPSIVRVESLRKAFRHPRLLLYFLRGYREEGLAREHVGMHLHQTTRMGFEGSEDPIELFHKAVDLCQNPCYSTTYLYWICRQLKPRKVVETGVHFGVSSAFILEALEGTGGRLYSIDLPNVARGGWDILPPNSQPGCVVPERLRHNWTLILGDVRKKLVPLLQALGQIDVFHHDSTHTYELMTFEFEAAWPFIIPGGLLLSHDVDRSDAFKDLCYRHSVRNATYKRIGIAVKN